jgi:hypothetical protein
VIDRKTGQDRNFYAYSTFAAGLMIVACGVLLSGRVVSVAYAFIAVILLYAAFRTDRMTLRVHAAVLLILATLMSRAMTDAASWLIQTTESNLAGLSAGYGAVLVSASVMYGAIVFSSRKANMRSSSIEAALPAAIVFWLASGLAALFLSSSTASAPSRTAIMTIVALTAAKLSIMAHRRELLWISYAFVGAAGVKFFVEDFRYGGSLGVFVSLTLLGATLIALPKLLRASPRHDTAMRAGA